MLKAFSRREKGRGMRGEGGEDGFLECSGSRGKG